MDQIKIEVERCEKQPGRSAAGNTCWEVSGQSREVGQTGHVSADKHHNASHMLLYLPVMQQPGCAGSLASPQR
eukprot:1157946-Pelagomonas_calceolata.AAC.6